MKLKNLFQLAILISIITFYSCDEKQTKRESKTKNEKKIDEYLERAEEAENNTIYTDAIEYNDAIVGIQTKVLVEVLAIGDYTEVTDMRKQLLVIQKETKSAVDILNRIYFEGDTDQKLKISFLKLFNFYNRIFTEDYERVLDLLDIMNNDDEDYDIANNAYLEMNTIIEDFSAEEAVLDLEFSELQESFCRDNRIFLDPSEHPLQEKLDNL